MEDTKNKTPKQVYPVYGETMLFSKEALPGSTIYNNQTLLDKDSIIFHQMNNHQTERNLTQDSDNRKPKNNITRRQESVVVVEDSSITQNFQYTITKKNTLDNYNVDNQNNLRESTTNTSKINLIKMNNNNSEMEEDLIESPAELAKNNQEDYQEENDGLDSFEKREANRKAILKNRIINQNYLYRIGGPPLQKKQNHNSFMIYKKLFGKSINYGEFYETKMISEDTKKLDEKKITYVYPKVRIEKYQR